MRGVLAKQLQTLSSRRARRGPLLAGLGQAVALAQRAYDDVATAERQVGLGRGCCPPAVTWHLHVI